MKILIMSPCFGRENSAITIIAHDLAYRGHDVRVVADDPENWNQFERHGDVDVLRVPLGTKASFSQIGLTAAMARGFASDADVIYVYAPRLTPALGLWLRSIRGKTPYVLHVQDARPDAGADASRAGKALGSTLKPWLRSMYRGAVGVIGAAPTVVNALIEHGAPAENARLVHNWVSEEEHAERRERSTADACVRFLVNNSDGAQDLETIVHAAKLVEDLPVKVIVVGGGEVVAPSAPNWSARSTSTTPAS